MLDMEKPDHKDIKVNVVGINHYTWLTSARYGNIDVMEVYKDFCEKYHETGFLKGKHENWMNSFFACNDRVKMDLFRKYGVIAAAGDRHLAEFNEGKQYLASPEQARSWGFSLTPVSWRLEDLERRKEKSRKLLSGEMDVELNNTGEEGVNQMRALLGLCTLVTNVNIPNRGQIPNLPMDAVVETNAVFQAGTVTPVLAGAIPASIYGQIARVVSVQEQVVAAAMERDLEKAFVAFLNDPLVTISGDDARALFNEMVENTKDYLTEYMK
jgi:alpha-galactosidase